LKRKRGPQFPLSQFIAIIVITISVFLVVDFARRTATTFRIKNEAARLEQEIAVVRSRRETLEARLNYVQSDAYVEELARTQLKWARPGETVVVVMATPQPVVTPPPAGDATPAEVVAPGAPWQAWWRLFFKAPPPE
jgi:cell division protein FtsB